MSEAESLPVWAVVVAAGSGERLGADRPKAFVRFGGRTLLAASLETLEEHPAVDGIVVVVPEGWEERTSLLADDLCAGKIAAAVAGGATRADSVRQRARRPARQRRASCSCTTPRARSRRRTLVDRVLRGLAGGADGVVPALPLTDTIKRVDGERVVETVDRSALVAVQTPQGFPVARLREAIERAGGDLGSATDCASLVERAGGRVVHVEGDRANLKVTTRDDLRRAERLLAERPG